MADKPTYEELELRIKELESHLEQMEETLRVNVERNELATSAAMVGVWDWNIKTGDFYLDPNIKAILGYNDDEIPNDIEIWVNYVHPEDSKAVMEAAQACLDGKTPEYIFEHRMLHKDGSIRWILVRGKTIRDESGDAVRLIGTDADITDRKKVEAALLENEKKLAHQAEHLEEVNTALKVLLEHREEERKQSDENVMINLKKLVLPYIEKIEKTTLNDKNATYLGIIKSNLTQMISPFANRLASKFFELTPSEIQIADLIKHGKTSKEIALMLNVSPKAISFHRGNIRKKLDLSNKKINLRSYLQSFLSDNPL